jgi:hypothetical protein
LQQPAPRISPSLEKYKIMARKIKSGIAEVKDSPIRELPSGSSLALKQLDGHEEEASKRKGMSIFGKPGQ